MYLHEGLGERPLGVNGEVETVDGDGAGLPGGEHGRQRRDGGRHAEQPQAHVSHVSFTEQGAELR